MSRWWDASWVIWGLIVLLAVSLVITWYDVKFWGSAIRSVVAVVTLLRTVKREQLKAHGEDPNTAGRS